jgi:tetratricopeptide (TPR) repeat protein
LITEPTPGRFTLHDQLRAYATEQTHTIDAETDRRTAFHRMLDHYLHSAHKATLRLSTREDLLTLAPPQVGVTCENLADRSQALSWFNTEHRVLMAATREAGTNGFETETWQLAWALTTFFLYQGHWRDQITTQRTALNAARRLRDQRGQAYSHLGLARAYTRFGQFDRALAHHVHALDMFDQLGDGIGQAHIHRSMSWMFDQQGRHQEALDHVQQALELYRTAGHQIGEARALNAVGWYYGRLGDYRRSLNVCQQALIMLQELGDSEGEAGTWDSLGYAHHMLGHYHNAIACYEQALAGFRDLGNRYNQTDTLTHLGDAHHVAGDAASASIAWEQALAILDELRHPDADLIRAKLREVQHLRIRE